MVIVLEGEQPISWNKFYSGKHWKHRHKDAHRVHMLMRSMIDPDMEPFKNPVDIRITSYRPNRLRCDPDNICAKLYIDGLVPFVIPDDDFNHVRSVTTAIRIDRENPRLVIEVNEA